MRSNESYSSIHTRGKMADLSNLIFVEEFDCFFSILSLAVDDESIPAVHATVVVVHHEPHLVDGAGRLDNWDELVFKAVSRYLSNEDLTASLRRWPGPARRWPVAPLVVLLVYSVTSPRH